jgi:hypothetical protein
MNRNGGGLFSMMVTGLLPMKPNEIVAISEHVDENGNNCPGKTTVHTTVGSIVVDGDVLDVKRQIEDVSRPWT